MNGNVEKLPRAHEIDFTVILHILPDEETDAPQPILDIGNIPMTLLSVCKRALLSDLPGEQNNQPSQAEKKRRGDLARFITARKKGCRLKAESLTLIKSCVAKLWPPLVVTVAFPLLDPSDAVSTDF